MPLGVIPRTEFDEKPKVVDRVLEVQTGQLCYIVGTIYIEMKMKVHTLSRCLSPTNALRSLMSSKTWRERCAFCPFDLFRLAHTAQFHLVAPPPIEKYTSPGQDDVMLEDESGRVRLIGKGIVDRKWTFVTGAGPPLSLSPICERSV